MAPALALAYSSASTANGPLGIGWSIGGLSSITRCGAGLAAEGFVDGVDFTSFATDPAADRFCLDGNKLVLVAGTYGAQGSEYRTELDTFAKITATAVDEWGPTAFEVRTKQGRIRTYAALARERFHVGPSGGPWSDGELRAQWVMTSDRDRAGNEIQYAYALKAATIAGALVNQLVLDEIRYTAHPDLPAQRTIKFNYKDRPDRSFAWASGIPSGLHLLLDSIVMSAPNPTATAPVWMYRLGYETSTSSSHSLLASVQRCGVTASGKPTGCAWKKQLAWTQQPAAPTFAVTDLGAFPIAWSASDMRRYDTQVLDANGDGSDDLMLAQRAPYSGQPGDVDGTVTDVKLYWGARTSPLAASHDVLASGGAYPVTTRLRDSRPLDIDGDGKVDLWTMYVTDDNGPSFDACAAKAIHWSANLGRFIDGNASIPAHTCGESRHAFLDWDGDGRLDRLSATDTWKVTGFDNEELVPGSWKLSLNLGGSFGTETSTGLRSGCRARVTDVDGDGRGELLSAKKSADGTACAVPVLLRGADQTLAVEYSSILPDEFLGTDYHVDPRSQFGDFNGDGLEDALLVAQPDGDGGKLPVTIRWNTGAGYIGEKPVTGLDISNSMDGTPLAPYLRDDGGLQIADFNRDGRSDVLVWTYLAQGGNYIDGYFGHMLKATIGLSNGDGTFTMQTPALPFGTFALDFNLVRTGDFNGDGYTDIAMVEEKYPTPAFPEGEHRLVVALQQPKIVDRLQAVRDEHAGWDREYVAYSTEPSPQPEPAAAACAYPTSCTGRRGSVLVRSVTTRDHLVDPVDPAALGRTRYYSYEDPVVETRTRRFIGFRKFRIWDPSRPSETIMIFDPRRSITHPDLPGARRYYLAQRPISVTTVTPIVKPADMPARGQRPARVTRTLNTHAVRFQDGGKTVFYVTTNTSELTWEQQVNVDLAASVAEHITGVVQPASPPKQVDTAMNFDAYGNPLWINRQTVGGVKSYQTFAYEYRVADWLIALLRQQTETRSEADNTPVAVKRTLDLGHDALGSIAWTSRELNAANPDLRTTTTLERDAFGNVTQVRESGAAQGAPAKDRIASFEYAPVFDGQPDERMFISQAWGPADVLEYRPTAWFASHPAYGVQFATMNVNGVRRSLRFDLLGRPIELAGDGVPTESVTYAGRADAYGNGVKNGLEVVRTEGGRVSTSVTDAAGRVLRTAQSGFGGGQVSVARRYDTLGRLVSVSRPYTGTATAFTQYGYDTLDRVFEELAPNGSKIRRDHSLFETHTFDANNYETVSVVDVDGRLVRSTNVVNGQPIDTLYSYGPFDLLENATDEDGHVVHYAYDVRGRLVRRDDPDRGTHTLAYNGLDQVREKRHLGTGKVTTYGYDTAGRQTAIVDSDGVTRFYFDTKPNGIGQLARAESPDGVVTEYSYDSVGRPLATVNTIDGVAYQVTQPHDAEGRPLYIDYPAAGGAPLRVVPTYNASDDVTALAFQHGPTTTNLITYQARTVDYALGAALLGNGLQLRYAYYPQTGWPQRFEARNTALGQTVFDLSYGYYANGLVQSRTDAIASRSERFAYDAAYRLTSWVTSAPNLNNFVTYQYDAIGNLETTLLNNTVIEASTFGKADGTAPHAIATRTVGATVEQYTHDLEGRQTAGPGRALEYRANDLPRSITKNGQTWQLKYDAFGNRVVKAGPDGTTIYIGELYERRIQSSGTKHVYLVHGPDGRVAQLVRTGSTTPVVQYLLGDTLGSTSKVASSSGAIIESAYFEPFGLRINADNTPYAGTSDVRDGFTGHETDSAFGLINMRGRMYDPIAKRFLSADPFVSAPTFGQSWNPYSYVANSPLNLTDPTGYRFIGEWGCLNTPGGCLEGTFSTGGGGGGGEVGPSEPTATSEGSVHAMDNFMAGSEEHARGGDVARSDGGGSGSAEAMDLANNTEIVRFPFSPELSYTYTPGSEGEHAPNTITYNKQRYAVPAKDAAYLQELADLLELFGRHTHVISGDPFILPDGTGAGMDNGETSAPVQGMPPVVLLFDAKAVVRWLNGHLHLQPGTGRAAMNTDNSQYLPGRTEEKTNRIDLGRLELWLQGHSHHSAHGAPTSSTLLYVPHDHSPTF